MNYLDRLDRFEPGTLTTRRQRLATYLQMSSQGRIPTWVERALTGRLATSVVGGKPRTES